MKKRSAWLLLVLAVIMAPSLVEGGARIIATYTGTYSGFIDTNTVVKSSPGLIYGITLVATGANAEVQIYDANNDSTPGSIKYEVREATANKTASIDFSGAPLLMDNGIVVHVTSGAAFLNYE